MSDRAQPLSYATAISAESVPALAEFYQMEPCKIVFIAPINFSDTSKVDLSTGFVEVAGKKCPFLHQKLDKQKVLSLALHRS
ncbi:MULTISPECIES: hypothetical protein [unclassified Microcoleus]|jgi:hypothetical protein|uniref:hypothetical protein n=1 Tax=unclassified Microcoleus TaxID=2642155 RepID=UPI002FCFB67C